jgi:hypothetical protein
MLLVFRTSESANRNLRIPAPQPLAASEIACIHAGPATVPHSTFHSSKFFVNGI